MDHHTLLSPLQNVTVQEAVEVPRASPGRKCEKINDWKVEMAMDLLHPGKLTAGTPQTWRFGSNDVPFFQLGDG